MNLMFYNRESPKSLSLLPLLFACSAALCFNYTAATCSFIFTQQNCTFYACQIQNNSSTNSTTSNSTLYRWKQCLSQCCSSTPSSPTTRTPEWLRESCQPAPDESLLPVIVGLSVAIPLFLLIVACVYCQQCKKHLNICGQDAFKQLEGSNVVDARKSETVLPFADEQPADGPPCSICLVNSADCRTLCGHTFHAACLVQWLRRNSSCPDCRTKPIRKIRKSCRHCGQGEWIVSWQNLEEFQCRICQTRQ